MTFTYLTAGESHGPQLTGIIEGIPAGLKLDVAQINAALADRQRGYGRGSGIHNGTPVGMVAILNDQGDRRT